MKLTNNTKDAIGVAIFVVIAVVGPIVGMTWKYTIEGALLGAIAGGFLFVGGGTFARYCRHGSTATPSLQVTVRFWVLLHPVSQANWPVFLMLIGANIFHSDV